MQKAWFSRVSLALGLCAVVAACGSRSQGSTTPVDEPEPEPVPVTVDVLAYNVWFLPPVARDIDARAAEIPKHLLGHDVVVLSEAFEDPVRERITAAMAAHGYTATQALGAGLRTECRASLGPIELPFSVGLNGGVVIYSPHRLEHWSQRIFHPVCAGEDCCSSKGVLYARLRRDDGLCLHIFGSHLQNQAPELSSEADPAEVRTRQLGIIREMIDAEVDQDACPGPVIVAGDLNLERHELAAAASVLHARIPEHFDGPRSWGQHSLRSQSDEPEHLDYVLLTDDYEAPLYSVNETRIFRSPHAVSRSGIGGILRRAQPDMLSDLSDHHPVAGHFEWGAMVAPAHVSWSIDRPEDAAACTPRYGAPTPAAGEGGFLCGGPSGSFSWSAGAESSCQPVVDCARGPMPPGAEVALCADGLETVFCPDGLTGTPCADLEGPRRCFQVVDPASEDPSSFDDYLCYRASGAPFAAPRPGCMPGAPG